MTSASAATAVTESRHDAAFNFSTTTGRLIRTENLTTKAFPAGEMASLTLKRKCCTDCGDLAQECPSEQERLACDSPPLLSSPLPDLANELLLKILAELPYTVETILTLATMCHRLNEFAMAYHFGRVFYELFDHTQRRPFTFPDVLRLSFIYKPSLSVWACFRGSFPFPLNIWFSAW
ncbi:hypothetical protein ARMSODRAFT_488997 [Armillaria solidipes]|uniref:F-box domain-containing protein n=1 Tax=Armillaria solidipes TaxID=1076256 RepID=A0A2H3CF16_9AGAR|nr:hypothetical protein ARMSODRAFT_488997 [Armillaria solidipes]